MLAFADYIPGTVSEVDHPTAFASFTMITIGINLVGFDILTWTLCVIADIQLKYQHTEIFVDSVEND